MTRMLRRQNGGAPKRISGLPFPPNQLSQLVKLVTLHPGPTPVGAWITAHSVLGIPSFDDARAEALIHQLTSGRLASLQVPQIDALGSMQPMSLFYPPLGSSCSFLFNLAGSIGRE